MSVPADSTTGKKQTTFVRMSEANFANSSANLTKQFITEVTEYGLNPF